MRFRGLVLGGAVWIVAAGCSASDPVVPSATVQTEIPLGQREVTTTQVPETTVVVTSVVPTSVVTETVAPTTRLRPAVVGPSPADLEALFAATLLADQVQRNQLRLPPDQRDRAAMLGVMTPTFVDAALKAFSGEDRKNRRYVKGTVDKLVILRIEKYQVTPQTADVIFCRQNNAQEYDTKGTPEIFDDSLTQEDLQTTAHRVQMINVDGIWKRSAISAEDVDQCSNAF